MEQDNSSFLSIMSQIEENRKRGDCMKKERWGVHENHCCATHGCKYGNEDCPVANGLTKQIYRCEWCYEDEYEIVDKINEMFEVTYETSTHFQWSDDLIFLNYDDAKKFLTNKGFSKVSNGFVSNFDTMPKAYITPKKVYKG